MQRASSTSSAISRAAVLAPKSQQATQAACERRRQRRRRRIARSDDDLYEQAVEVVIREGRGSVSLLQRALGIGYGRAARMIDYMAEDGIVGDYNGSKCREVVMSLEEWRARQSGRVLEELQT